MASGGAGLETWGVPPGIEHNGSYEAQGTTTPTDIRNIEGLMKSVKEGILNQLPKDFGTNLPLPQMLSSSEVNPQPFMLNEYEFRKYVKDEYSNSVIYSYDSDSDSDPDSDSNLSQNERARRRIIRHFATGKPSERFGKHNQIEGNTDPLIELDSLKERGGGHLCITGPAGSGKSTLLKIVAGNLVKGLHGYDKVKFVHVVYHEQFRKNIKCSAQRTLFSHNVQGKKFLPPESQSLFSFVDIHRNEVILIIDGLDTLPQDLDRIKDPGAKYDCNGSYSPLVHLKMLLSRKLLDGCRVVTSSRTLAIRNFKDDELLRHTKFISLRGFSEADANKVLESRSPENAKNISKTFQDKPHFLSLFKEPLFLTFLIGIWENIKNSEFIGATNVMLEIIKFLYKSEHKKGDYDKLPQVKEFAQNLLWQKRLTFDETILAEYDLDIAHFKDLSTLAHKEPLTNSEKLPEILNRKVMIIFCHQSFHELFAAYNVLESKFSSFEGKLKRLHKPYYHKTREFVYGLAFKEEKSEFDAPGLSDLCKKREALKTSIEEKFYKSSELEKLAIFESLAEAISEKHHFDLKTTSGVDFSGIAMSDWEMYCTGISLSQFNSLQKLHLEHCSLRPSHMRVLQQGLCKCNNERLQILSFSLEGNKKIGKEGVGIACKIVRERNVTSFNLGSCELDEECMGELQDGLQRTAVPNLVLKNNALGKEGMDIAGRIVRNCSTEDVDLTKCAKTSEEVQAFAKSANGSQIDRLTVTDDNGNVVSGYGHVIRACRVKTLILSISAQQPDDGKGIKEYSATAKVAKLLFVNTRKSIQQFHQTAASKERLCNLIISLLTVVEEEVLVPVSFENVLFDNLSRYLYGLNKGPKIRFRGELENVIERSSNTVILVGKKRESVQVERLDESTEEDAGENDEIAMEMEAEFMDVYNGSDTVAWLRKYDQYPKLVADVLAVHGLSIHRFELNANDRNLVAKTLSHCSELKKFNFSHSEGLKPMLEMLDQPEMSLPKVANVCFAGHPGIDKELSDVFVKFLELFQAEGLVLTSVNASHKGLQCLRDALKRVKQGEHFKRLEIFHNPEIDDEGWKCLAGIAKDFEETPLELSACYCDVKDGQLETFKNALGSVKLGKIDISGNRTLKKKGFQTLGEIVKNCEVPSVALQDCNLDKGKVQSFNTGCEIESSTQRITYFNVANNTKLGKDGIEEIKKTVHRLRVENLNIASCMLGNITFEIEFESLNISGNPTCESISELAKTVKQRLYLRNCMLNTTELMNLAGEMKKQSRQLEEIDVSDCSRQIDPNFVDSLVGMFKDVTEYITVADGITIPTAEEC